MTTEAQKRASAKYDRSNTKQMLLKFNINTDCDILEQLDKVSNKQGYIKSLIRSDMVSRK